MLLGQIGFEVVEFNGAGVEEFDELEVAAADGGG